ncbi:MAG: tRNA epoxyqueuosine(34) reductase QueG [Elusimicrobia bacterium]|nr:tRNA epoxyqueuosine(34) reductase QueG [Elusimicrobiota bacterium]
MSRELGFDRVAFTGPDAAVEDGNRLASWSEEGKSAGMVWLTRDPARRASPRSFLAEARSVITLAVSYQTGPLPPAPGAAYGRVARYAWGLDYHPAIEARLDRFKDRLRQEFGDVLARPSVDAQPFLERAFARRAGLGFVGKNTNLIIPGVGSTLFLANLVVNLDLPSDDVLPQGCGSCIHCAERCTTGALDTPFSLDARRCIAYHTIENREDIPPALRHRFGDWLFGCDDCQDVCPFNARPLESQWPEFSSDRGPGAWLALGDILQLRTPEAFKSRFAGTSLLRSKRSGLVRNACLVAVHRHAVDIVRDELIDTVRHDPEPLVRSHAAWALGRSGYSWARIVLESARGTETHLVVRNEIEQAIESSSLPPPPKGENKHDTL